MGNPLDDQLPERRVDTYRRVFEFAAHDAQGLAEWTKPKRYMLHVHFPDRTVAPMHARRILSLASR